NAPLALINSPYSKSFRTFTAHRIQLDGLVSKDEATENLVYLWTFGDTTTVATGPVVSHAYYTAGVFNITLTVQDSAGLSSFFKVTVIVEEEHPNAPPQLVVHILNTSVLSPEPFDPPGTVVLWPGTSVVFEFNIIDENVSSTFIFVSYGDFESWSGLYTSRLEHLYSLPGLYQVNVTATDVFGLFNTTSVFIRVAEHRPIVRLGSALFVPDRIEEGGNSSLEIRVENAGGVAAKDAAIVIVFNGEMQGCKVDLPPAVFSRGILQKNSYVVVPFYFNIPKMVAGQYEALVKVFYEGNAVANITSVLIINERLWFRSFIFEWLMVFILIIAGIFYIIYPYPFSRIKSLSEKVEEERGTADNPVATKQEVSKKTILKTKGAANGTDSGNGELKEKEKEKEKEKKKAKERNNGKEDLERVYKKNKKKARE
ncbi:MAG: PKD domain-containing protein, partial [Thermoplasmata archaeon]